MQDERILELANEIDDFDAESAWYQVWVFYYDKDQMILDHETFVDESRDPNKAIESAKKYLEEKRYVGNLPTDEAKYLEVQVETVVDLGEDGTQNVGNLFDEYVEIE